MQLPAHEPPELPLRFTPPDCTHLRVHYSSGTDVYEVHSVQANSKREIIWACRGYMAACSPFLSGPKHNFNMNGMYPLDSVSFPPVSPPSMQITLTKATCLKDLICRPDIEVVVLKHHVKPWNTAKSSASVLSRNHATSGNKQFSIR